MNTQTIKENLKRAEELVKDIEDLELRKIAFGKILDSIISDENHREETDKIKGTSQTDQSDASDPFSRVASNLGKPLDDVREIFIIEGEEIHLKVKPTPVSSADRQRMLAHFMLFAYKVAFKKDSLPATILVDEAKEWDIWDANFGRNVSASLLIQTKGKSKGTTYSLTPGATEKAKLEILSILQPQ